MKSQMTIDVDFLAGTTLLQAIIEAKQKAKDLDVAFVCFKFNGVKFSIGRDALLDDVLEKWDSKETRYGIVAA